jgi:hypothetical protein
VFGLLLVCKYNEMTVEGTAHCEQSQSKNLKVIKLSLTIFSVD